MNILWFSETVSKQILKQVVHIHTDYVLIYGIYNIYIFFETGGSATFVHYSTKHRGNGARAAKKKKKINLSSGEKVVGPRW